MPPLPHLRVLVATLVLATAFVGCAHRKPAPRPVMVRPVPPPQPPSPPPPPPKVVNVTVLPLDQAALPEMADEINNKLAAVRLPGAAVPTMAAVSMETAQMQSECTEPTDGCYLRVARLLEADRMLWAQVERVATKGPKRRKAKPIIKIQMFLFDRDTLGLTGQAEGEFPGQITTSDIDRLVTATVGSQMSTVPPAPAPAGMTPAPVYPAQQPAGPAPRPTYAPAAPVPGAASAPASQPATATPAPAAVPAPTYPGPAAAPPPAAAPVYPGPAAAPPPASPAPASFPPTSAPAAPPRMQ